MFNIDEYKKEYEHPSYLIMNANCCAQNYPKIYEICYCFFYKGKVPQRLIKELNRMQSNDIRKFNYVPDNILSEVKSFVN